ncbi:Kinesin-like protein unc-104 [Diplonema papillatum]|nr:Kinesin-like protein unc-104 [Diplonema papillatum]
MMEDEQSIPSECSVTVAVRVRPLNSREKQLNSKIAVQTVSQLASIALKNPQNPGAPHNFTFDHAWDSTDADTEEFATQETVYNDVGKKVLAAAFQGYNACIFAYGQTGSGKTFCMMGVPESEALQGVIPRLTRDVFDKISKDDVLPAGVVERSFKVEASYLEIYQENVKCLLNPNKTNMKVREHPQTGPYVEDLTKMVVDDFDSVLKLLEDGSSIRQVASTKMNDASSRSHAIFTLLVTQTKVYSKDPETGKKVQHETVSKINLVDLAGSERAKSTGATGQLLAEGAQINKSLSTLGLVISGLAEMSKRKKGARAPHIPFRDSTLTWLLKDNLGGNSKTFMISTVSPAEVNHDETLSTLRYADRAKAIVTKAKVNEDPNTKLIRQLREELAKYKTKLTEYEEQVATGVLVTSTSMTPRAGESPLQTPRMEYGLTPRVPMNVKEAGVMRDKLRVMEKLMAEAEMSWEDKEKATLVAATERAETMKRMGITTVHADGDIPHFVNLVLDGGWLVQYLTPETDLFIGSGGNCSFRLPELGAAEEHAVVRWVEDVVRIKALHEDGLKIFIPQNEDGTREASEQTVLPGAEEGERLVHGATIEVGENLFRFVDPRVAAEYKAKRRELQRTGLIRGIPAQTSFRQLFTKADTNQSTAGLVTEEQKEQLAAELREKIRAEILAEQAEQAEQLKVQNPPANEARHKDPLLDTASSRWAVDRAARDHSSPGGKSSTSSISTETPQPPAASNYPTSPVGSPLASELEFNRTQPQILEGAAEQFRMDAPEPEHEKTEHPSVQAKAAIPILKLHESALDNVVLRTIGTARAKSMLMKSLSKNQVDKTEPAIQLLKQTIVILGAEGVGKSSVLKCLQKELSFWERKDVPSVAPTLGSSRTEVKTTVDGSQIELLFEDVSGNPVYTATVPLMIPSKAVIFALVWDLSDRYEESVIMQWLDLALAQAPGAPLLLIGTHRDECRESDVGIQKILKLVENTVLRRINMELMMREAAPKIIGTFAVSAKNRTVTALTVEGKKTGSKFKDLLKVIAEAAHQQCMDDEIFPKGMIPTSVPTLASKIAELRTCGEWRITGAEYKTLASQADSKYHFDTRELARVTHLLHCWKVLLHFSNHPTLRKQIFTDTAWVLYALHVVHGFHHYQLCRNKGAACSEREKQFFFGSSAGQNLPFDTAEALARDTSSSFTRGILTLPLAATLFANRPNALAAGQSNAKAHLHDKIVAQCLQLLTDFDLLYPILPPAPGTSILVTTPLGDAPPEKPVVPVYLIPSFFQLPFPGVLIDALPSLMTGIRKKLVFRPSLPPSLFTRLLARVARCVQRLFVGRIDPLTSDKMKNTFWKNGAWIQDSATTRAMLWVDGDEIRLVSNIASKGPTPSRLLVDGLVQTVISLTSEHSGAELFQYAPCTTKDCPSWLYVHHDSVTCNECNATVTKEVLKEGGACFSVKDRRSEVMGYFGDSGALGALIDKLALDVVEEPSEDSIADATRLIDGVLEAKGISAASSQSSPLRIRTMVDHVVALQEAGDLEAAERAERAIQVVNTQEKLRVSATALDEVVQHLTNPPPLNVAA